MYDHSLSLFFFSKMLAASLTQRIAPECLLYNRKKHGSGLLLPGCAKRFFPQPAVSTAMQPSFESEHALPHAARALRLQRRRQVAGVVVPLDRRRARALRRAAFARHGAAVASPRRHPEGGRLG